MSGTTTYRVVQLRTSSMCIQSIDPTLVLDGRAPSAAQRTLRLEKICSCDGFTAEKNVARRPGRTPTPPPVNPFLMIFALSRLSPRR